MINGINHVGLSVLNIERSISFYRDLFGMEVIVEAPFGGERYETIFQLKGTSGRAALLKLKGSEMRIELFEFRAPPPESGGRNRPVCDHGITHFCISVSNIESEYERLKAAGVSFHCPPLEFSATSKATYGRDPDGNVFELLEKAEQVV